MRGEIERVPFDAYQRSWPAHPEQLQSGQEAPQARAQPSVNRLTCESSLPHPSIGMACLRP